jgi:hypothetical protein
MDLRPRHEMRRDANAERPREPVTMSVPALTLGAVALGAFATGALAIGAVAIGGLVIGRARIRRLEIDELVVRRLRLIEALGVPPQADPEG